MSHFTNYLPRALPPDFPKPAVKYKRLQGGAGNRVGARSSAARQLAGKEGGWDRNRFAQEQGWICCSF